MILSRCNDVDCRLLRRDDQALLQLFVELIDFSLLLHDFTLALQNFLLDARVVIWVLRQPQYLVLGIISCGIGAINIR